MGLAAQEAIQTEQKAFTPIDDRDGAIVPFGIYHLDLNLIAGVKPTSPQLNVIQGGGGARKTTLMLNLIVNMCLSGTLPREHVIIYDTLESGMTIERIFIVLRCMLATKYLIYKTVLRIQDVPTENIISWLWWLFNRDLPGAHPQQLLSQCVTTFNGQEVSELAFTPDFIELFYKGRVRFTANQIEAWMIAGEALQQFPIEVFGVSEHANFDEAERRSVDTTDFAASYTRWVELMKKYRSIQVVSDYLQAYWIGGSNDHYEKQKVVTPYYEKFVKGSRTTLWAISQEGVTHQREFRTQGEVLGSSGGDVLKNASHNNWRISYPKVTDPFHIILHTPVKSRRGNHPDLALMIEPNSGVIFGKSRIIERN